MEINIKQSFGSGNASFILEKDSTVHNIIIYSCYFSLVKDLTINNNKIYVNNPPSGSVISESGEELSLSTVIVGGNGLSVTITGSLIRVTGGDTVSLNDVTIHYISLINNNTKYGLGLYIDCSSYEVDNGKYVYCSFTDVNFEDLTLSMV